MKPLYIRLSVLDRCNLRCRYCSPARPSQCTASGPVLSRGELLGLVGCIGRVAPVRKIRLTGGEPLLRKDLGVLISALRERLPSAELCLTTNGILLGTFAAQLKQAGLDRVNVSLDTTRPGRFAWLTRGGRLNSVLEGLGAARQVGFKQLRLNAVLMRRFNGDHLVELVRKAVQYGGEPRFIELMPFGVAASVHLTEFLSADAALDQLSRTFTHVRPLDGPGTATRHLFRDGEREFAVGFIRTVTDPFCSACDRVRLDSRGRLMSCLRRPEAFELGQPLREGRWGEVETLVRKAVAGKRPPEMVWPRRRMTVVGG